MGALEDLLASARGRRIPGGCALCNAHQSLEEVEPGIHLLTVSHETWCQVLWAAKARNN